MATHIVQSPEWGEFRKEIGTPYVRAGNVQYTKHKIPFSNLYYGYCPRVNPFIINFEDLKKSALENNCININFDVPNITLGSPEEKEAEVIFNDNCEKAPRDQFAKGNVILDISPDENTILGKMHKKHKYNIGYAEKHGVKVKKVQTDEEFEEFYKLYSDTFERQKYYGRSHEYMLTLWRNFEPKGLCSILTAYFENEPLASWMFFNYEEVLYYPYGGSSEEHRNLFGSTLLAWDGIKYGKSIGCKTFDMWGTSIDPNDEKDPYYGFTNFKMKFGGKHVVYLDSYDFVIDRSAYTLFNTANILRWKLLKLLK